MATSMPMRFLGHLSVFLAALAVRPCGAMHERATERCSAATQVAAAPDPDAALGAFLRARAWLDLDELPAPTEQSAQLELTGTTGVCVVLRQDGRLVGIGEDAGGGPLMLRRAVGRAVSKALADDTVREVRAVTGDRVTARLALEVELAGARRPLIGRTIADAVSRLALGDEGIALHRADAVYLAFPARLLATDSAARPDSTVAALLIEAGLPAKDLPEFATDERVSLSRFQTIRLREPSAGAAPSVVTRAGRVIEPVEITPAYNRALATRLAARLAAQVVDAAPGDPSKGVRLLGTYNPTADRYAPPFADARDAALALIALAESAACDGLPDAVRAVSATKARALARSLMALSDAERPFPVDEACAIALARLGEADAGILATLRERIDRGLRALGEDAAGQGNSVGPMAMTLAAACALDTVGDGEASRREALDALVRQVSTRPGLALEGALPIALLARARGTPAEVARSLESSLRAGAAVLRSQQLGSQPAAAPGTGGAAIADFPPDLEGGIPLPGVARSLTDTAGLRFAAGFALLGPQAPGAAGEPDPAAALLRGAVRFVAQHTADEPWVDAFRRPEVLRGLVRRSLIGDDCPPSATALGLVVALGGLPSGDTRQ